MIMKNSTDLITCLSNSPDREFDAKSTSFKQILCNIDLADFDGREERLQKVIRYNKYSPMFYRTNLLIHTKRVRWMFEDIIPYLEKVFPDMDVEKGRIIAEIHDDPEIITGDTLYCIKNTMSREETIKMKEEEEKAIDIISKDWPKKINGYSYKDLLLHASRKDIIETIAISYVDKIDAWCESLHELFAGNSIFHSGEGIFSPPVRGRTISEFPDKFPQLKPLFVFDHPFFSRIPTIDKTNILRNGSRHTLKSISKSTGIPHYDRWKYLTMKNGGLQGISWLINPVEKIIAA